MELLSVAQYGDAKLPELGHVLANCPKAKAARLRCDRAYSRRRRLKGGQPGWVAADAG
jgi:hypothetical protein